MVTRWKLQKNNNQKTKSCDICKWFIGSLGLNSYSSYIIGNFHDAPNEIHLHLSFGASVQGFLAGVVSGCFLKGLFDGRQGSQLPCTPTFCCPDTNRSHCWPRPLTVLVACRLHVSWLKIISKQLKEFAVFPLWIAPSNSRDSGLLGGVHSL